MKHITIGWSKTKIIFFDQISTLYVKEMLFNKTTLAAVALYCNLSSPLCNHYQVSNGLLFAKNRITHTEFKLDHQPLFTINTTILYKPYCHSKSTSM